MSSTSDLTPQQTHALFDILSHHETYAEIEGFRFPDAVTSYGYPFRPVTVLPLGKSSTTTPAGTAPSTPRVRTPIPPEDGQGGKGSSLQSSNDNQGGEATADEAFRSSSPLLQTLLTRFVLPLPGIRDLPRDFWAVRVQGLLSRLGEAELSESYDKGALGTRKTLATGASAVLEMLGRGALGGVRRTEKMRQSGEATREDKKAQKYDCSKAEELERAWDDVVDDLVYGSLMDEMFDHLAETDDLEGYSPAVQAAAEYAIIQYVLGSYICPSHRVFAHSDLSLTSLASPPPSTMSSSSHQKDSISLSYSTTCTT